MNHVKDLRAKNQSETVDPKELIPFFPWLMSPEKKTE